MSEGEGQENAHKVRRESLGLKESDVAALIGWSVNKVRDAESGKAPLSAVDEERFRLAIESLAAKKARRGWI